MKLVVASLVILSFGALASVNAQSVSEVVVTGNKAPAGSSVRTKTVNYADLDLSKSEGVNTLLDRIRGAASEVCSPQPQPTDASDSANFKKCLRRAVNSAARKIDNPTLTAMVSHTAR